MNTATIIIGIVAFVGAIVSVILAWFSPPVEEDRIAGRITESGVWLIGLSQDSDQAEDWVTQYMTDIPPYPGRPHTADEFQSESESVVVTSEVDTSHLPGEDTYRQN